MLAGLATVGAYPSAGSLEASLYQALCHLSRSAGACVGRLDCNEAIIEDNPLLQSGHTPIFFCPPHGRSRASDVLCCAVLCAADYTSTSRSNATRPFHRPTLTRMFVSRPLRSSASCCRFGAPPCFPRRNGFGAPLTFDSFATHTRSI